jgi:hypothetical protein
MKLLSPQRSASNRSLKKMLIEFVHILRLVSVSLRFSRYVEGLKYEMSYSFIISYEIIIIISSSSSSSSSNSSSSSSSSSSSIAVNHCCCLLSLLFV